MQAFQNARLFGEMLTTIPFAATARRFRRLAWIGLFTFLPVSAGGKAIEPRDPKMRRIVAKFEATTAGVPRQFRADLTKALTKCGQDCNWEAFAGTLVKSATFAQQKLTASLKAAHEQLKERARSVKGPDGVLGAAGELSRSIASLEMSSLRLSSEMTESLAALRGARFGGEPLLTTLQLRLVSLVYITPIDFGLILTSHAPGSPTASIWLTGSAPPDSTVLVSITCGSAQQTLQTVATSVGNWVVFATLDLSSSTTCRATATAGSGIAAGSITREIDFH